MTQSGAICIPFCYAAGAAGSRFLTALRDMRILGSHCVACARVLAPLRSFCPKCGADRLRDVEIGPEGTVVSWTERADGVTFALVRLDRADTPLLHRLLGVARRDARVRPRFATERHGGILDLIGFEPIDGGSVG